MATGQRPWVWAWAMAWAERRPYLSRQCRWCGSYIALQVNQPYFFHVLTVTLTHNHFPALCCHSATFDAVVRPWFCLSSALQGRTTCEIIVAVQFLRIRLRFVEHKISPCSSVLCFSFTSFFVNSVVCHTWQRPSDLSCELVTNSVVN